MTNESCLTGVVFMTVYHNQCNGEQYFFKNNSYSGFIEIARLLVSPNVHYRVYKSPASARPHVTFRIMLGLCFKMLLVSSRSLDWTTAPYRLSMTAYLIFSQLPTMPRRRLHPQRADVPCRDDI
jgi:hypothetical protein